MQRFEICAPCRAEEERLRLAEDVLVKERELTKLREEKHTLKSRLEEQANFYVRTFGPVQALEHDLKMTPDSQGNAHDSRVIFSRQKYQASLPFNEINI